jgi:hypothetical protein
MITLLPWAYKPAPLEDEFAAELYDAFSKGETFITKTQSRKSSKKRKQYKDRQQLMSALVERVMTKIPEELHGDSLFIGAAVEDMLYWGNADVRQKARSYGSKRKSSPKVRSSFVKHRQGDSLPLPEWSWEDVRGSRAVYYS